MAIPEPKLPDPQLVPSLRWGILAPGEIATQFVQSITKHTNQRVVSVASRSIERARVFAERLGIRHVSDSYEALCSSPEVDVVYVASHIEGHLEHARLAIKAGKHVLVEKPFSYSPEQAEELLSEARSAGVLVMEAMWTRYLPQSDILRQLLENGTLGNPEFLQATFAVDNRAIERLWKAGTGGIVFDMGIYPIALAHFFLGEPETVTAHGRVLPSGLEEGAHALLTYSSGAQASLTISGVATLPSTASLSATKKSLVLDHPFFVPTTLHVNDKELYQQGETWRDTSAIQGHDGLSYQATYLAHYVSEGCTESPIHTHAEIVSNLRTARRICTEIGSGMADF